VERLYELGKGCRINSRYRRWSSLGGGLRDQQSAARQCPYFQKLAPCRVCVAFGFHCQPILSLVALGVHSHHRLMHTNLVVLRPVCPVMLAQGNCICIIRRDFPCHTVSFGVTIENNSRPYSVLRRKSRLVCVVGTAIACKWSSPASFLLKTSSPPDNRDVVGTNKNSRY
jgi:hypothetical protein